MPVSTPAFNAQSIRPLSFLPSTQPQFRHTIASFVFVTVSFRFTDFEGLLSRVPYVPIKWLPLRTISLVGCLEYQCRNEMDRIDR